jgi:signal transduction histidine kinase
MRPTTDDFVLLNRFATIGRTVAATAHQINNALLVVSGTVELMDMSTGQPASPEALTRLSSHSAMAADCVRELVQFIRADVVRETVVDLHAVAASAVAMRAFNTKRAGITLTHAAAPEPAPVRANPPLLLQAFVNLLLNAEQALAGVKPAEIHVTSARADGMATLSVRDSAAPVADELRGSIFDPWVTTRAAAEHAGLGLTAARRIAERFGGTLRLDADGKTFVFSLPVGAA